MTTNTLVIGASSGIGKAIAEMLAEDDSRHVFAPSKMVFPVCEEAGATNHYLRDNGPWNEIVYSAGVNYLDWIGDIDYRQMVEIFGVNVQGFIWLLNQVVRCQGQDHPARVVAISSDAASRPLRTSLAYCASKAALDAAIRGAARELGPFGWRVNGVAPGMTQDTEMTRYIDARVPEVRGWDPAFAATYEQQQTVIKRRAHPLEIAEVVEQILTGPDYVNGNIVTINGGR